MTTLLTCGLKSRRALARLISVGAPSDGPVADLSPALERTDELGTLGVGDAVALARPASLSAA